MGGQRPKFSIRIAGNRPEQRPTYEKEVKLGGLAPGGETCWFPLNRLGLNTSDPRAHDLGPEFRRFSVPVPGRHPGRPAQRGNLAKQLAPERSLPPVPVGGAAGPTINVKKMDGGAPGSNGGMLPPALHPMWPRLVGLRIPKRSALGNQRG